MSDKPIIPPTPSDTAYQAAGDRPPVPDAGDPVALFADWLRDAAEAEPNDPNAMALATVDPDGMPDVRMVLLKDVGEAGFTFFTHRTSAKGSQIEASGKAALGFHWKSLRRQVRVRGPVVRVPEAQADAYFASRARISQLGAWASDQSQPLGSRSVLQDSLNAVKRRFGETGPVPRPDRWVGYAVVPETIEFWQDQPWRLHDRLLFTRDGHGWARTRLCP